MRTLYILLIIFSFSVFFPLSGSGQSENGTAGLFDSDELLKVKLTAKVGLLINDLGDDADEHPATLSYMDNNGEEISLSLKVRTRGNFRKDPDDCNFPPLKLFLSEEAVSNTIFEGQDEIKLVTHCMTNQPEYEQFLFKEYLVYRLYNEFTSFSFRVRLAEISYIEEENPDDRFTSFVFFIERPKNMAGRNEGKIINIENFSVLDMDENVFKVLALFQYMIANNDWFVSLLHNIELVTVDPLRPPVPVPYDFDWSGIVEAPYRYSYRDSLDYNNSDRSFKGICGSRKEFIALFDIFKAKRADIFELYEEFELLDIDHKGRTIQTISEFFNMIDRTGYAIQELRKDCN